MAKRIFQTKHPILSLLTLSFILLLPILIWGFPRTSDDGETHVRWQYFYGKQMWAGDPFPRWIRDIADGFGSPVFFIYPPLPHYVAALLTPFSDGTAWVQHRLAIATALACFLGGVGCFLWLREVTRDRHTALIGAVIYLLAPYHLFVDTYFRAAYAELWALACAPFALAGIHLLASRRRTGLALYIFGTSALLMSHAPTALILMPLYVIYSCLLAAAQRRADIVVWTGIATCCAVLLSGIYLGTALTQQAFIHTEELYTGYFNFNNWLIFNPNPVSKRAFDTAGFLQAALTLIFAGSITVAKDQPREWRWLAVATVLGTCLLFFLMTSFSATLWAHIPAAQKIQFPWRLQTAQTVLLALAAALCLRTAAPLLAARFLPARAGAEQGIGGVLVLTFLAMNGFMLAHAPARFNIGAPVRTLETTEYTLGNTTTGTAQFAGHDKVYIGAGTGSLTLLRWAPRYIEFDIDAATTAQVFARQFTYTGWVCRDLSTPGACKVLSSETGDIVHVQVAPGKHRIVLRMPATRQERLGQLASLLGLIVALITIFVGGRRSVRRLERLQAPTDTVMHP